MIKKLHTFIRRQLSLGNTSSLGRQVGVTQNLSQKSLSQVQCQSDHYQPSLLQRLEPRFMFDGAAFVTVDLADGVSQEEQDSVLHAVDNTLADAGKSLFDALGLDAPSVAPDYSQYREVVIIDGRVLDPHVLIGEIGRESAVEVIMPDEDGVEAIARILEKYSNLSAIHILSHGDQAQLHLGNVTLNSSNLNAYQAELSIWGQALSQTGDILFYGCNVAEGAEGQAFVDQLKTLTEADIAASTDLTASSDNGGDSELEYSSDIDVDTIVSFEGYEYALDHPIIQNGDVILNYTENENPRVINSVIHPVPDFTSVITSLQSATITITSNYSASQDRLALGNTTLGITGSFNQSTGVLTLQGSASYETYETALRSVTYQNISDNPSTSSRSVLFRVSDGAFESTNNATSTINITATNDAPKAANGSVTTNEDTVYTFTASNFNFTDVDGNPLAKVKITALENVGSLTLNNVDVTLNQEILKADIDAGNLKFTPVANANGGNYSSFAFAVRDGQVYSDSYTMMIHVNAVNDVPVLTAGASLSYTENDVATVIDNTITVTDIDSSTISSATIQITGNYASGQDVLVFSTIGNISGSFNSTTGVLTLSGGAIPTDYQTALRSVKYQNTSDNPSTLARTISWVVKDDFTASSTAVTSTINVSAINDAPVNTVPGAKTVNEDTALAMSGISVNDVDGNLASTRLQVTNGTLTITLSGAATISSGTNGSSDLTISGSQTDINATLASLSYQGNLNFNGSDTLTITSTDSAGTPLSDVDTVAITVTAVNDAPVNTVPGAKTVNEDTALAMSGISVNDVDGNLASTRLQVTNGTLTITLSGAATISSGTNGSSDLTISGSQTDINATLASLSYQGNLNFNGSDTLTITSTDSAGTPLSDVDTVAITVTAVNDAPTAANNTVTTTEDTDYTFSASDFNFADIDGNSLASIKVTTLETVGSLKLNNVDVTLDQVISKANIDAGLLKFTPVANANGASYDSFSFKVSDGTVESSAAYTMTMNVTAVNDAPTAVNSTVTTNEDTDYTFSASDFNFADIDGNSLASIKVTNLETVGSLKLNGVDVTLNQVISRANIDAGLLKFTPVANANGSSYDSFSFKVNDGTVESSAAYTMTIDVTAVNDAPTAANSTVTTNEDTDYTFSASDFNFADIDGNSLASIKVSSLETVGSLKLNGVDVTLNQVISRANIDAGLLKFTPVPNADGSSYDSFSFKVNDGIADSLATYTMAIDVTAINDPPVGGVTITGTPEEGQTLTVNHNITDVDGLGELNYQWYRNGNPIAGAINNSYTLIANDATTMVYVTISYVDGGGILETVQSNSLFIFPETRSSVTKQVIVPADSTIVDNNGVLTITTSTGSRIVIVKNSGAIISESAGKISVDYNGDGISDMTAPSGSIVVANDNGTITTTTSNGSKITTVQNSSAIISEIGGKVNIDSNGDGISDVTVPSGSTIVDNGNATLTIVTSTGNKVTVEKSVGVIVSEDGSVTSQGIKTDEKDVVDINVILSQQLKTKQENGKNVTDAPQSKLLNKEQTPVVISQIRTPEVVDVSQLASVISEFKQGLEMGASLKSLSNIATNLVQQSKAEGADGSTVGKEILREVIEAQKPSSTIGQIAASILNTAVAQTNVDNLSRRMIHEMVAQILISSLNNIQITEIFAEMILKVDKDIQHEVIGSILSQEMLSDEQVVQIEQYLAAKDQETADVFSTQTQQIRSQNGEVPNESSQEINKNDMELGMLNRLKFRLLRVQQMDAQEAYSELDHRYAILRAKSDIMNRFL